MHRAPYDSVPSVSGNNGRGSLFPLVIVMVLFLMVVMWGIAGRVNNGAAGTSTIQREKVESGNAYVSDCIVDEIGWISNASKLSSNLKEFYEETGCQPYIYLRAYDPAMDTDAAREAWSQEYYDEHFAENQNVVLYTYFCDEYDEGVGNDTLFVGTQSGLVFDSEAQEIFWNKLDYDWDTWDTEDNDGMFADVFNKTASTIMRVSTTAHDVARTIAIVVGVIGAGVVLVVLVGKKYKREKERAEETERILNTPLHASTDTDDLADRYTDNE